MSKRELFNMVWHTAVVITIYFGLVYMPVGMA